MKHHKDIYYCVCNPMYNVVVNSYNSDKKVTFFTPKGGQQTERYVDNILEKKFGLQKLTDADRLKEVF